MGQEAENKILDRIVALGEVVADVYWEATPSAVELPLTARPGGAPANVAVAASRLGFKASFIGTLEKTSLATLFCGLSGSKGWMSRRFAGASRPRELPWRS